ncbi:MAG: VWA domain-containing protein [Methanoregulaceae archaeon]|nr:VWA domain-containing protein [Methanoregulaceae archaeon]
MTEELDKVIDRLLCRLPELLDSCSEHDITTDIFVKNADATRYREILREITEEVSMIRKSGCSCGDIVAAIEARERAGDPVSEEIVPARDLVPLICPSFTKEQEDLISEACDEWSAAVAPEESVPMQARLSGAIRPLTLGELLSPEVTRMQRVKTFTMLQSAGLGTGEASGPGLAKEEEILIPVTDDLAVFSRELDRSIFRFLAANGFVPKPRYPGMIFQALEDLGTMRVLGNTPLRGFPHFQGVSRVLYEGGSTMSRMGEPLSDVRKLYHVILEVTAGSDPGPRISPERTELLAGHVLAGFIAESGGLDNRARIARVIDFVTRVASRPDGREMPGPDRLRALGETVSALEHLARVITGDYAWRAVAMTPAPGHKRQAIDLRPERMIFLYDPDYLAFQTRPAASALLMDAFYQAWFQPNPDADLPLPEDLLFPRLTRAVTAARALKLGTSLHPGALRWFEKFLDEEYSVVNRLAGTPSVRTLPPEDQFLEGVLAEGRIGGPSGLFVDDSVKEALEETRDARMEAGATCVPDGESLRTIRDRIWPALQHLRHMDSGPLPDGQITTGRAGGGFGPELTPGGSVRRMDTSLPGAHQPADDATVKAIEGKGPSLLDDGDGFSVPGGSMRRGSPAGGNRGTGPMETSPGSGGNSDTSGPGDDTCGMGTPTGQPDDPGRTAGEMVKACAESEKVMKTLLSARDKENQAASGSQVPGTEGGAGRAASALDDLAGKIGDLAGELEKSTRRRRDARSPGRETGGRPGGGTRTATREKALDSLLRMSEKISEAAREYRNAIGDMTRKMREAPADPETARSRLGMTEKALQDLRDASVEFQRLSGAFIDRGPGRDGVRVPLPESAEDNNRAGAAGTSRKQRMEPSFHPVAPDAGKDEEMWESLSYFDASFGEGGESDAGGQSASQHAGDSAEMRYEQGVHLLTREAEQYLSAMKQRTRSEWETLDERAERIRRVALLELHSIRQEDYALYQRFYQPVAGLTGVARKNIQQVLQKERATREQTELITGSDIDEENLAAVRTTMRIFKESARQPDKTPWCLSLLIDASSSMHDETVAKKLEATIQAAILFGEALNRIAGIRFEIAAFADTEYIPLKRYQDKWNLQQACYLIRQVIQASGGTNDVGAISSAIDRMNRSRAGTGANRMIFVVSDGQSGVGGREQMMRIRSVNREIRIFGWGVGPDMEKIEYTYKPYGTHVKDIADLPRSLGDVLRRELGRPVLAGFGDEKGSGETACTN